MLRSSLIVVITSFRDGTFSNRTGLSDKRVAAKIGSAAFFAPEMSTSPSSGTPPVISSLSKEPHFD